MLFGVLFLDFFFKTHYILLLVVLAASGHRLPGGLALALTSFATVGRFPNLPLPNFVHLSNRLILVCHRVVASIK